MENILCSNCGASLKESTEFCDSCGEWQGVSPTKEKSSEEQAHGHTYHPVKKSKDRRRANKIGPRKRHSRKAPRQGDSSADGARGLWMTDPGLFSVNKIFENMEETQIFNVNQDIKSLITELEEKDVSKKDVEKNEA